MFNRKSIILVSILITIFVFSFVVSGFGDEVKEKDWKLVTSLGVLVEKAGADAEIDKALVLTLEYDKFMNDSTILYAGSDVVFSFSTHDTVFKPFVGVEYVISDVTSTEVRIDYNTKDKSATLLVRMIWTW